MTSIPSVRVVRASKADVSDRPPTLIANAVARLVAGAPGAQEHLHDGPLQAGRLEAARLLDSREVAPAAGNHDIVRPAGGDDAGVVGAWPAAPVRARDAHLLVHVVHQYDRHCIRRSQRRRPQQKQQDGAEDEPGSLRGLCRHRS